MKYGKYSEKNYIKITWNDDVPYFCPIHRTSQHISACMAACRRCSVAGDAAPAPPANPPGSRVRYQHTRENEVKTWLKCMVHMVVKSQNMTKRWPKYDQNMKSDEIWWNLMKWSHPWLAVNYTCLVIVGLQSSLDAATHPQLRRWLVRVDCGDRWCQTCRMWS